MRAVGTYALTQRPNEIGLGPSANSGLRVRRDVRTEKGSERRLQGSPASKNRRALFCLGMAADATAGLGEIQAALRIALRKGGRRKKRKRERPCERCALHAFTVPVRYC